MLISLPTPWISHIYNISYIFIYVYDINDMHITFPPSRSLATWFFLVLVARLRRRCQLGSAWNWCFAPYWLPGCVVLGRWRWDWVTQTSWKTDGWKITAISIWEGHFLGGYYVKTSGVVRFFLKKTYPPEMSCFFVCPSEFRINQLFKDDKESSIKRKNGATPAVFQDRCRRQRSGALYGGWTFERSALEVDPASKVSVACALAAGQGGGGPIPSICNVYIYML